jgi:hypothetical protein
MFIVNANKMQSNQDSKEREGQLSWVHKVEPNNSKGDRVSTHDQQYLH